MTEKSILKNPIPVLLLGGWYLLTGAVGVLSFVASLFTLLLAPALGGLVSFPLFLLGGLFIALKVWGAWRYVHLDAKGLWVLLALEAWGALQVVLYYAASGFGLPVPGDAGAQAVFTGIEFLAIIFLLAKISVLLYTRKYVGKPS